MRLTCRAGAAIRCTADKALSTIYRYSVIWELMVVMEAAPDHPPARCALVSFCWDAGKGWVSSVSYA